MEGPQLLRCTVAKPYKKQSRVMYAYQSFSRVGEYIDGQNKCFVSSVQNCFNLIFLLSYY